MQKKPTYSSSPTAVSLILLAATMPFNLSSAQSVEGSSTKSSLAQREIMRRTQAVAEADRLFAEGREAYAKAEFQVAVDKYKQALGNVRDVPALVDRHESYTQHLADASVALAQSYRKIGKYDEARLLLEGVLAADVDPDNAIAKTELNYLDDPIRTNPVLTYDHVKNVDQVRRTLYKAQGYYDLGKYDQAKKEYEDILRIDPYNEAARRGMEKVADTKSDYYRAAYGHTRAELLMQVDQAWELSVPADVPTFNAAPTSNNIASDGVATINAKLRNIIIPKIDFEDRTVEEAIDYLRLRAAELDVTQPDPAKKGVNLVIRRPKGNALGGGVAVEPEAGAEDLLGTGDLGAARIDELRLRNVPLGVALKYICDKTKLRFKVDDFAVTLVPMTEEGNDVFTRTFRVPPDFVALLMTAGGAGGGAPDEDPFAAVGDGGGIAGGLSTRPPITELLKNNGILFPDGSAATLGSAGTLLVTNTLAELDKVEQLVDLHMGQQPKQVKITTKFVEITQENSDELGFDWVISPFGDSGGNIFGTAGTLGSGVARTALDFINPVNGTSIPGIPASSLGNVENSPTSGLRSGDYAVNRNSIDAILNNPNRSLQKPAVAPGILGVTGLFSDGQIQMIMRGLAQKKGSDLMTAPSVTARSGQKATIEVIREFIYPLEYEPPTAVAPQNNNFGVGVGGGGGGGAATTPASPVAWETRNTGVTLEIEPNIGENDFVIDIRFLPQIVEFEGFINYGSPILAPSVDADGNPVTLVVTDNRIEMPVFSKRSVDTSLTIYDGYTVAVGGLMREDVQIVEDKVPILGDIPYLGRLFQSESENRIKSNLIIFVTAEIIDPTGRRVNDTESSPPPEEELVNPVVTDGGGLLPPPPSLELPAE